MVKRHGPGPQEPRVWLGRPTKKDNGCTERKEARETQGRRGGAFGGGQIRFPRCDSQYEAERWLSWVKKLGEQRQGDILTTKISDVKIETQFNCRKNMGYPSMDLEMLHVLVTYC